MYTEKTFELARDLKIQMKIAAFRLEEKQLRERSRKFQEAVEAIPIYSCESGNPGPYIESLGFTELTREFLVPAAEDGGPNLREARSYLLVETFFGLHRIPGAICWYADAGGNFYARAYGVRSAE